MQSLHPLLIYLLLLRPTTFFPFLIYIPLVGGVLSLIPCMSYIILFCVVFDFICNISSGVILIKGYIQVIFVSRYNFLFSASLSEGHTVIQIHFFSFSRIFKYFSNISMFCSGIIFEFVYHWRSIIFFVWNIIGVIRTMNTVHGLYAKIDSSSINSSVLSRVNVT